MDSLEFVGKEVTGCHGGAAAVDTPAKKKRIPRRTDTSECHETRGIKDCLQSS